jgi:multiple sugar transport system substrate-binding protein
VIRSISIMLLAVLTVTTAQAQTHITIGVFPDLDSHLGAVLPVFMEENPDIEVEMRVNQHGDHHTLLVTSLAGGTGANDVEVIDAGFIARFVAEGGLTDLASAPYDAGQYSNIFADYAWQQARTTDGRIVALPTDLGPGVMFYRRDRLDEVDATVDTVITDWDSYVEFGREVTRDTDGDGKDDVFLIADAGDVARAMIRGNLQPGEGVYFNANGQTLVNSDRFREAFAVAKAIRDEGLDARISAWTNEWYETFKRGTAVTHLTGAWMLGHMQNWMAPETSGLWGTSHLPGGTVTNFGGSFYGIPEQSENKEAAWKLVQFLTTNPEIQLAAFDKIGAFPAVTTTYGDPMFGEPIEFLAGQPARGLFAEVAEGVQGTATHPNDMVAEEIVNSALAEVLDEGRDIGAALAEAEMLIMRRTRR